MSGVVSAASGATSSVRLDYTSATTVYGRFYFAKTGNPTVVTTLVRLFASGTGGVDLRVNTTGALVFRNGASSTIFTSGNLANSTLHRVEFAIVHSDTVGRMMLRIYSGANAHGTVPDLEYGDTTTDRDTNASSDNFRFGVLSNPSTGGWSAWFDDIELDDADWVGPSITAPAAISDLAGTAGDTQVTLTHSAPSTNGDAIDDYVFQYSDGTQTASAFGTVATENGTSLGAANAQPLPSSAASGDLIVAIVGHDSAGSTMLTASTGWTVVSFELRGSRAAIMARVLDGTTGDNVLSISGAAQDYAVALLRFPSGQHGCTNASLVHDLAWAWSTGLSGNADPPSVDAGSSADRVWLTACILDCTTGSTISAVPTNYTSRANVLSANSTSSVCVAVATRDLSATQTEDPGTFTNTSRDWVALTLAIPPAEWTTFSDGTSTSTGATVTGLTNSTAYTFRAAAVNGYGQGPWSNVAGPYTPAASGGSVSGTGASNWGTWSATAAATVEHPATVSTTWGAWSATSSATRETAGTAASNWGAWSATSSATVEHAATISTTWGAWSATASATRETTGTAASNWGAWSATAAGAPDRAGTISTTWGAWSATAAGTVSTPTGEVFATGAINWGAWSATAAATVEHAATVATTWGAWSATSSATVEHAATVATTWGVWSATAAATVTHGGTVSTTWGAWSATGAATVDHPATISTTWGAWTATAVSVPDLVPLVYTRPVAGRPHGTVSGRPAGTAAGRLVGVVSGRPAVTVAGRPARTVRSEG